MVAAAGGICERGAWLGIMVQGITPVRTSVPPVACVHFVIDMRWWL